MVEQEVFPMMEETKCENCQKNLAVVWSDLGNFVVGRSPNPPLCIPCVNELFKHCVNPSVSSWICFNEHKSWEHIHTPEDKHGVTVEDKFGNRIWWDMRQYLKNKQEVWKITMKEV